MMQVEEDPLDALKKLKTPDQDPLDQLKALRQSAPPTHDFHAEFKSGALDKRMQGANARDVANANEEADATPGYTQRLATHVLNTGQGIPGVEAVEAGAGALGSQLTDHPMGYRESLNTLRDNTNQIGGKTSVIEHMMGGIATAPFLPKSPVGAGAGLGGADALLAADPESLTERAVKTVAGAGAGAVGGKLLKGLGNVAQRTGLTDKVSGMLSTLGGKAGDVAEAIGTKGAGNRLLGQRQQVQDELAGSEQSAQQAMLDHIDAFKSQAKQHYDAAKQDQNVVADPRVQRAMQDPRIAQIFQVARDRIGIGNGGETVVKAATPEIPRLQAGSPASTSSALANMAESGFAGGVGDAGVVVPHGQRFADATSPQNTVAMMKAAVAKMGAKDFRAAVDAEITKRGVRGNVDAEKAVVEQIARNAESGTTPATLPAGSPNAARPSLRDAIEASRARSAEVARRAQGGTAPNTNPFSSQQAGETYAQRVAREALERRSAESSLPSLPSNAVPATLNANPRAATPEVTADLPTPEELAMAKRLVRQVVQQKFNATQGISAAEAAQLAPLLDDLTTGLHNASPSWKLADNFYANGKNFELAYQKAFGVQQKVTAAGLDPSKLKTPEAMNAWVAKGKGSTGIARASGQQAGAAGRINEAVRNAPLGTDIAETLKGANGVFQPSETAAAIRRPAFGSPEAAQQFSELIGGLIAKGEKHAASYGPESVSLLKPWKGLSPQNTLATPAGGELRMKLSTMLADPKQATALRAQLSRSKEGQALLQQILRTSLAAGNGAFAN